MAWVASIALVSLASFASLGKFSRHSFIEARFAFYYSLFRWRHCWCSISQLKRNERIHLSIDMLRQRCSSYPPPLPQKLYPYGRVLPCVCLSASCNSDHSLETRACAAPWDFNSSGNNSSADRAYARHIRASCKEKYGFIFSYVLRRNWCVYSVMIPKYWLWEICIVWHIGINGLIDLVLWM